MTFGQWLRAKRKAAGLSQEQLAAAATARGAAVSGAYISNIERGYDTNKKGNPIRPGENIVEALAHALGVQVNEARLQANYAPLGNEAHKPKTLKELIEYLDAGGISLPMYFEGYDEALSDPDGEGYQEAVERIYMDMEMVVKRITRGQRPVRFIEMTGPVVTHEIAEEDEDKNVRNIKTK